MTWLRSIGKCLRSILRRGEVERELDDELRFHIDMQTEENLRAGMSPEEARRQAVLLFGGVEGHREAARDARGLRLLDEVVLDARYAARGLHRNLGFTLVAAATLALGIGANSALFSLANGLLWTPPPGVGESEGLSWVEHVEEGRAAGLAYPDFLAFRDEGGVFAELAAVGALTTPFGGVEDPEQLRAEMVTASYFTVLRMRPALGRGFAPGEDEGLGSHPVVVLSHDLWSRRFGSDPAVLGRQITLGGSPFTVIGVAAEGFRGLTGIESPADLWVPVTMYREASPVFRDTLTGDPLGIDHGRGFSAVGRLKPALSGEEAVARLDVLTRRAAAARPEDYEQTSTRLRPLGGVLSTSDGDALLFLVWGAVTMIVLLIACGNVANLLLARAAGRSREIAVRAAIGASRARIVRQLLVESLLLALLGGAAGLLLGAWTLRLLLVFLPIPLPALPTLEGRVLLVTLGASLLTGIVFGLSPALRASRPDLNIALRDAAYGGRGRARPQRVLIAAQLALSFVLVAMAGLLVMNMRQALAVDSVYSARDNALTLAVDLRQQGYLKEQRTSFKRELLERLSVLPGVVSVSLASNPPGVEGFCTRRIEIDGVERVAADRIDDCTLHGSVGADYFATVGAPLVRGREFTPADREGAPKVVIVNEMAARLFWPGADPIGRQLRTGSDTIPAATVVGIVPDALDGGEGDRRRPTLYWPAAQEESNALYGTVVILRTRGDPARLAGPARAEIRAMDPNLPVRVATLRAVLVGNRSEGEIAGKLLLVFGALALCLSLVGLHGLVAFTVVQRTREVGIRVALGATRGDVLALFGRDTMRTAGAGVAIGLVLAAATAPAMNSMLNGLEPNDVLTVLGVAAILLAAALAATVLPARRATRVDPMVALRAE